MKKILIIHGPNLNLLGTRKPEVYGSQTLSELNTELESFAVSCRASLEFFQSNHEGDIIDCLHKHRATVDGVVINPGAFTHYSYAIRDAIEAIDVPTVEVHLSDISKREDFRKTSVIEAVCQKQFCGQGVKSYTKGIKFLC
jgi:3-dehydroquinate dehydratase-2